MRRPYRSLKYVLAAIVIAVVTTLYLLPGAEARRHRWFVQEHGSWVGTLTCRPSSFRPDRRPCHLIVRIDGVDYEVHESPALRALHHESRNLPVTVSGVRQHSTWLTRNEIFETSVRPLVTPAL